eukprot:403349462
MNQASSWNLLQIYQYVVSFTVKPSSLLLSIEFSLISNHFGKKPSKRQRFQSKSLGSVTKNTSSNFILSIYQINRKSKTILSQPKSDVYLVHPQIIRTLGTENATIPMRKPANAPTVIISHENFCNNFINMHQLFSDKFYLVQNSQKCWDQLILSILLILPFVLSVDPGNKCVIIGGRMDCSCPLGNVYGSGGKFYCLPDGRPGCDSWQLFSCYNCCRVYDGKCYTMDFCKKLKEGQQCTMDLECLQPSLSCDKMTKTCQLTTRIPNEIEIFQETPSS